MTLTAALMRALYLRTLHRHVGPSLRWQVRNPANTNSRAVLSPVRAAGQVSSPTGPHFFAGDA